MSLVDNIKKAAIGNKTKIQTSEATQLEKIFNQMFYLEKDPVKEIEFVRQVMTRGQDTQERVGLHASALIAGEKDFCVRSQVLSLIYKQLQGEQIDPGLKRIFEQGNAIHEKWQRLFIRAKYSEPKDLDFTQFNDEYMISFTPDIICKIPQFYDGRMVGEIKSVNTFQFQHMTHHPSAGKQLQWYMFLTGIHKGFVLSEDKNTQDFKIEFYEYDPLKVATYIERVEMIKHYYERAIHEGKMVKRPEDAKKSDCKRCVKCAMRLSCWNLPGGKVKL